MLSEPPLLGVTDDRWRHDNVFISPADDSSWQEGVGYFRVLSVRVEIATNLELRLRRDVALRAVYTANVRVSVGAKQIRSRGDPHRLLFTSVSSNSAEDDGLIERIVSPAAVCTDLLSPNEITRLRRR